MADNKETQSKGQQPTVGIVSSGSMWRARLTSIRSRVPLSRKKKIIVVTSILAIAAAFSGLLVYRNVTKKDSNAVVTQVPSQQEALKSNLETLKNKAPASSTPAAEQTAYYDRLVTAHADNKEYKQAVEAFEKRVSISTEGLTYVNYANVATYYKELGDKPKAGQAFDKAISLLPAQDNPDTGYVRQNVLDLIDSKRKAWGV